MSVPGIFIALASSGRTVDIRWALSLPGLSHNVPVGSYATWMSRTGPDRAANREYLCEKALEAGSRYIFMLDDDTVCPNTTLKLLVYEMEKDPKIAICGGIYCTKDGIPYPLVFKKIGDGAFWAWKKGEVFDCEGIGTGCMLIRPEVLSQIPKPWFKEPYEAPENESLDVGGEKIPISHRSGTDDLYFCRKVIDSGFRVVAHGGVLPSHIDQQGGMHTLMPDTFPMQGPKLVAAD